MDRKSEGVDVPLVLSRLAMSVPPEPRRSSNAPPFERKRPWYLILALICAWVFGASAASEGCATVNLYKSDPSDLALEQAKQTDREAVEKITQQYVSVLEAAKTRMFPLAIASLLLGSVMWGLAAGAMAGRNGARSALLQVMAVHALVVVLAYAITPDVRAATVEARVGLLGLVPEPRTSAERDAQKWVRGHLWAVPTAFMALQLAGYGLVLLALTRRRTREFFEAASATRTET